MENHVHRLSKLHTIRFRAPPLARARSLTNSPSPLSKLSVRHFHPTRPTPLIPEILEASSAFLYGVHSITGLPWAASIPLTAIIVRTVVAMPLQIYARMHIRREQDLTPVVQSWRMFYEEKLRKDIIEDRDQTQDRTQGAFWRRVSAATNKKHGELKRRWRVMRGAAVLPFLQFPVWISLMESVRAMCGDKRGLLAYFFRDQVSEDGLISVFPPVEPTLATEGALWFPDLLAGDPSGVLPLLVTGTILLNVAVGWKSPSMAKISQMPTSQMRQQLAFRAIKLIIQLLAVNIGMSAHAYGMPAGLMIYWITSGNIATLQSLLLDRLIFPKPMESWKKLYIGIEDASRADSEGLKWIAESPKPTKLNGGSDASQVSKKTKS